MLLIVGTIRLSPENLPSALPAMTAMVSASRAEDGCIAYSYAQDLFDPGLIHVVERWRDRAALDRHFATSHIAEWRSAGPALGISDRDLHLYETARVERI